MALVLSFVDFILSLVDFVLSFVEFVLLFFVEELLSLLLFLLFVLSVLLFALVSADFVDETVADWVLAELCTTETVLSVLAACVSVATGGKCLYCMPFPPATS